jgi:hypothetical protein
VDGGSVWVASDAEDPSVEFGEAAKAVQSVTGSIVIVLVDGVRNIRSERLDEPDSVVVDAGLKAGGRPAVELLGEPCPNLSLGDCGGLSLGEPGLEWPLDRSRLEVGWAQTGASINSRSSLAESIRLRWSDCAVPGRRLFRVIRAVLRFGSGRGVARLQKRNRGSIPVALVPVFRGYLDATSGGRCEIRVSRIAVRRVSFV